MDDVLPFMPVPPLGFTNPSTSSAHPVPPPPFPVSSSGAAAPLLSGRAPARSSARGSRTCYACSLADVRRQDLDGGDAHRERRIRSLSPARAARAGRHGGGLQGQELRRRGLREDPRHQAHPARARAEPGLRGHVHPRGEARRSPLARQHRPGVRPRQGAGDRGSAAGAADAYYMAMEYVHGLDLASVLARAPAPAGRHCPSQLGVYVASEVAKGLDHAHRRRDEQMRPLGIVHRDVSPQNVLLSFEGEVKVTDFGIAKARGALDDAGHEDTRARKLQGKFGYMSPEQARGESVDARSDLFSLGTVLYECVAGVNPFSAPTTFETLRRVQACEYPPVELLRPDAPPELVAILKTAMAKEPADRYPDAGRMYEALLAFLYAQGSRYGAHDLAEFLARFRDVARGRDRASSPEPLLEAEAAHPGTERTPVEIPVVAPGVERARRRRARASSRSIAPPRWASGARSPASSSSCRATRRRRWSTKAASIVERWGGRVLRREAGHIAALFGLGDPDGRDTEMATRCALVALRSLDASRGTRAPASTSAASTSRAPASPTDDERLGSAARHGARPRPRARGAASR